MKTIYFDENDITDMEFVISSIQGRIDEVRARKILDCDHPRIMCNSASPWVRDVHFWTCESCRVTSYVSGYDNVPSFITYYYMAKYGIRAGFAQSSTFRQNRLTLYSDPQYGHDIRYVEGLLSDGSTQKLDSTRSEAIRYAHRYKPEFLQELFKRSYVDVETLLSIDPDYAVSNKLISCYDDLANG